MTRGGGAAGDGAGKIRNDFFSPLSNNSSSSVLSNNTMMANNGQTLSEQQEVSLIAHFAQLKKSQQAAAMEKHVSPSTSLNNLKSSISPKSSSSSSLGPQQQQQLHQQQQQSNSSQSPFSSASNLLTNGVTGGTLTNGIGSGSAMINSIQIRQLEDSIHDKIDDFRDELMSENFRFKAEMFKEFMSLRADIQKAMQACSINEALVDEIARLREENKRLKKLF
jgi:hypothetical protein